MDKISKEKIFITHCTIIRILEYIIFISTTDLLKPGNEHFENFQTVVLYLDSLWRLAAHVTGLSKHFRAFDEFANSAPIFHRFFNNGTDIAAEISHRTYYIPDRTRFRNAEDSQLSWVNRTLESISSSDARVRHLEKLQQASNGAGAFRRPRQLRASIGSVTPTISLQNHRSEREINKGFGNCFICSRSRGSKSSSRAPPRLRDGGENLG